MKNFILFGRGGKVTMKTLGLIGFLFTLTMISNPASAQLECSLVAQDELNVMVDENCEATITPEAILGTPSISCPGYTFEVFLYDGATPIANGNPAIVPAGYAGETLSAVVVSSSGNESEPCILNIFDNIKPTLACYERTDVTDEYELDAGSPTYNRSKLPFPCTLSPGGTGDAVAYYAMHFEVTLSGSYTMDLLPGASVPANDFYAALYEGSFDPMDACGNVLTASSGSNPSITESLTAGTNYILVTSARLNGEYGQFSYDFTAPTGGQVHVWIPDCNYTLFCYQDIDAEVIIKVDDNCDAQPVVNNVGGAPVETNNCISGLDDNVLKVIFRNYQAEDAGNNLSTLLPVTITIEKLTFLDFASGVVYPENRLASNGTSIECDAVYPTNPQGNPDPSYSGAPSFVAPNGVNTSLLTPDQACNLTATYMEMPYTVNNSCVKQFYRIWTVTEWSCENPTNSLYPYWQTIEIADQTDPTIECPANVVLTTDVNADPGDTNCGASYTLPKPVADDNCNAANIIWSVNLYDEDHNQIGTYDYDYSTVLVGNTIVLPLGVNTIEYFASDGCGNDASCLFTVTVEDKTAPTMVCQTFTTVALTHDGEAEVPAESFDSGTWDDCGEIVKFEVRRDDAADPTAYFDYITFDCDDMLNPNLMIWLRAWDDSDNWDECMVRVEVQDKLNPLITCPPDEEIGCDDYFDPANLRARFGWPVAYDNCDNFTVTTDSTLDISACGVGTIVRNFTVTDAGGRTAECTQTITIGNSHPFGISPTGEYDPNNAFGDIVWPADVTDIVGCLNPYSFDSSSPLHPDQSGYPILNEDQCDIVGPAMWDDMIIPANDNQLNSTTGACFKILRTWTVVDWCNQVNGGVYPMWQDQQVIMVNNYEAPVFSRTIPDTTVCTVDVDCVDGFIGMSLSVSDLCTTDSNMKWQYKIDEFNDEPNVFDDYVSPIVNGNQLDANGDYPIGTHRILWTAWDQCGNSVSQVHLFTIQNCKKPTPMCVDGLTTDLGNMGGTPMVMVDADFFDPTGLSSHSCDYRLVYSFSADTLDKTRTYFCDDTVGVIDIEMWVTAVLPDLSITQDFCTTTLDVEDHFNICPASPIVYATVSGGITDERDNAVTGVNISLEGSEFPDQVSDENGSFAFPQMITGGNYRVNPAMNDNHANGVSTLDLIHMQKHLLGLKAIESPYKMIAADVNMDQKVSASDLLDARELILGVTSEFANNTSWRFIQADYEFENEANPLTETFPEFEVIENIQYDVQANFIAIKVGDITNDASLNGQPVVESRNANTLRLELENVTVQAGAVEVPVYAKDFNQINGFQFTLNFDPKVLKFEGMESGVLNIGMDNYYDTRTGNVTVSWNRPLAVDVEDDAVLFVLNFQANNRASLNELLSIGSAPTRAEAYDADLQKLGVDLNFRNLEGEQEYLLYQNTPNPFSDNTVIRFNMRDAGQAEIVIYDMSGKVLKVYQGNYQKGMNAITVRKDDLPATGILYYQMNTDAFNATRKMILIK
jgi:hypothetical protein